VTRRLACAEIWHECPLPGRPDQSTGVGPEWLLRVEPPRSEARAGRSENGALQPVADHAANGRRCPKADTNDHPHGRRGQVDKGRSRFARRVRPTPRKPVIHCLKSGYPRRRLSWQHREPVEGQRFPRSRVRSAPIAGRAPSRRAHTGTCAEHDTPVRVMPERCPA